jgi:hypothetical protein
LAAPAAVSALVAVAPRELVVQLRQEAELPVPAQPRIRVPPVLAWRVVVGLARLPVLAHLVVEAAVPVELLSRQSFSAAMARSSP